MTDSTILIRFAQVIAIGTAGFSAGATFSISHIAIPALSTIGVPNAIAVRQWNTLFDRGKSMGPTLALLSLSAFAYLTYTAPTTALAQTYATAGGCVIGIVPYTLAFLTPTNKKLKQKVAAAHQLGAGEDIIEVGMPKRESTKDLLQRWRMLNYVRSMLPLAGMGLALWSALS